RRPGPAHPPDRTSAALPGEVARQVSLADRRPRQGRQTDPHARFAAGLDHRRRPGQRAVRKSLATSKTRYVMQHLRSRRDFLRVAGTAAGLLGLGAVLQACGGGAAPAASSAAPASPNSAAAKPASAAPASAKPATSVSAKPAASG